MILQGKTALITGGSRGIGRAIAVAMATQGANIAIVYAGNTEAANEALALCEGKGVLARAYRCDVTDRELCAKTIAAIAKDIGSVDILVNNAGITRDKLLLQMSEEDIDLVLDTNLKSAFHLTGLLYSSFLKKRQGRIVNITSVAGLMGNVGQANYAAAKAGLIGFTKSVAKELASRGVTCNAIAPGFIETDMTHALGEAVRQAAVNTIPQKRFGSPDDVANLAVFLASDLASYITGEVIRVDGGMCM